jgi:hypothetical protein
VESIPNDDIFQTPLTSAAFPAVVGINGLTLVIASSASIALAQLI